MSKSKAITEFYDCGFTLNPKTIYSTPLYHCDFPIYKKPIMLETPHSAKELGLWTPTQRTYEISCQKCLAKTVLDDEEISMLEKLAELTR